jgi:hypothetical protein
MKNLLILLCLLGVSACSETVVPVTAKWPDAPPTAMMEPPHLVPITKPNPQLSDLIQNANKNYSSYRTVADQVREWQKWYHDQKAIWETVK